jgi:Protein of unknown function (DUF4232)
MGRLALTLLLACALGLAACGGGGHKSSSSTVAAQAPATTTAARPAPATTTQATPAPSRPAGCAPAQLRLQLVSTQGATGHVEAVFSLTNQSGSTCRLFGYPGAQMVTSAGVNLKTVVKRGGGFFPDSSKPPTGVVLQPGTSARFTFEWAENNEFNGGSSPASCPRAGYLQVTPPNDYSTLVVPVDGVNFAPCNGMLTASPVYPP